MIILLYLIVISGWALLILIIKCRKAREKRIAMEQQQAQAHDAVHVIQIGNSFYDVIPITRCQHSHSRCRGYHIRHSDSSSSLSNSHVNPSFVLDEGVYPSAPASTLEAPPSYDEVIRLPSQYPKRNNNRAEQNPPSLAELENENNHSIMTITSQTPAIFTTIASQQHTNNYSNNIVPFSSQLPLEQQQRDLANLQNQQQEHQQQQQHQRNSTTQ